jgi:hypothetical protein
VWRRSARAARHRPRQCCRRQALRRALLSRARL